MSTRRPHAAWFALSALPIAVAVGLVVLEAFALIDDFAALPRTRVPGQVTATLPAGPVVVYAESSTVLDGVGYTGLVTTGTCTLHDDGGAAIALTAPRAGTHYQLGRYDGREHLKATLPRAGAYTLRCEGDGVVAIGPDITRRLVVGMLVRLLGGFVGAGIVAALVAWRRRRRTP